MVTIDGVKSCGFDKNGNIQMELTDGSGKFYTLSFDLSIVPSMLVLLNKFFCDGIEGKPVELLRSFVGAYVPTAVGLSTLPDGSTSLDLKTQSGMHIPLVVSPEFCKVLAGELAHLQAIRQAEAAAPDKPKH